MISIGEYVLYDNVVNDGFEVVVVVFYVVLVVFEVL